MDAHETNVGDDSNMEGVSKQQNTDGGIVTEVEKQVDAADVVTEATTQPETAGDDDTTPEATTEPDADTTATPDNDDAADDDTTPEATTEPDADTTATADNDDAADITPEATTEPDADTTATADNDDAADITPEATTEPGADTTAETASETAGDDDITPADATTEPDAAETAVASAVAETADDAADATPADATTQLDEETPTTPATPATPDPDADDTQQRKLKMKFFSDTEVQKHNIEADCWVSYYGRVYNLTPLIQRHRGLLCQPIIKFAGSDISHWFDADTREPVTHISKESGLCVPYCPHGRYVHVGITAPASDVATHDTEIPWWRDDQYCVGLLSRKKRTIRLVNMLTSQADVVEVCSEETLGQICDKYLTNNENAGSYVWKRLGRPLNPDKTLEENGLNDESREFEECGIPRDTYVPTLHLYFNDDVMM